MGTPRMNLEIGGSVSVILQMAVATLELRDLDADNNAGELGQE